VSQTVADGVHYLTGGSHHSVAIEMKDHVIVVEAPINDDRTRAVLAEVRTLVPNKPVRYLVNTHHHFDHAGGVRGFVAHGVRIVTHETNANFLHHAADAPSALRPDLLSRTGRHINLDPVRDLRVLSDGTRVVEVRHIAGNLHADGLLMVYLPKEKLLIEADAYTPPPRDAPAPAGPANPFTTNLLDNIARQGLAVEWVLPLHGRMAHVAELQKAGGHSHGH
jgi:glyoxylase-like metal-dependent hydrolase (beta-lactamase superfamily II)